MVPPPCRPQDWALLTKRCNIRAWQPTLSPQEAVAASMTFRRETRDAE
jgi:hypothetical protein